MPGWLEITSVFVSSSFFYISTTLCKQSLSNFVGYVLYVNTGHDPEHNAFSRLSLYFKQIGSISWLYKNLTVWIWSNSLRAKSLELHLMIDILMTLVQVTLYFEKSNTNCLFLVWLGIFDDRDPDDHCWSWTILRKKVIQVVFSWFYRTFLVTVILMTVVEVRPYSEKSNTSCLFLVWLGVFDDSYPDDRCWS